MLKALRYNMVIRRAVKRRMFEEHSYAQRMLSRTLTHVLQVIRARKLRKKGYFNATIYLELSSEVRPENRVEIFGEFSDPQWSKRVLCPYDHNSGTFKTTLMIKVGHQFKFVIDNGKKYVCSKRYALRQDQ